jgi:hypothetical protein
MPAIKERAGARCMDDFDPICLKGKHWEIIKLDIIDFA